MINFSRTMLNYEHFSVFKTVPIYFVRISMILLKIKCIDHKFYQYQLCKLYIYIIMISKYIFFNNLNNLHEYSSLKF